MSSIMCFYVLSSMLWCSLRFPQKTMFGSSLPPVVCRSVHVLFTLFCVCLHIVVSNTYCVVFFFVLCILCCQFLCVFLRLVYPMLPVSLCFSSSCVPYVASFSVFFFVLCILCCQFLCVFLRLVYLMLPVSLDCSFLIVPSVFPFIQVESLYFKLLSN